MSDIEKLRKELEKSKADYAIILEEKEDLDDLLTEIIYNRDEFGGCDNWFLVNEAIDEAANYLGS